MKISHQVRNESYYKTLEDLEPNQRLVFDAIRATGAGGITAWEIMDRVNTILGPENRRMEIYVIRPRITELCELNYVRGIGKQWHEPTRRNETVWTENKKEENGQLMIY